MMKLMFVTAAMLYLQVRHVLLCRAQLLQQIFKLVETWILVPLWFWCTLYFKQPLSKVLSDAFL
jgi:hypothetical protein